MKQRLFVLGFIALGLYFISAGISYAVFSGKTPITTPTKQVPQLTAVAAKGPKTRFNIDPATPKNEVCPMNGVMYTAQEKAVWDKRRPLAVMIENSTDARPQSGLSYADIVYESAVEGGITRFMGVFYCGIAARNVPVAPVRSARTYFLPWVVEYDALYNHVGGAGNCDDDTVFDKAKALCQIGTYKIKDMDEFGLPFKYQVDTNTKIPVCYRNPDRLDHEVATEHTMVCETDGLIAFADKQKGWTNVDATGVSWDKNYVPWKFTDEAALADRGEGTSISFVAWKNNLADYGVKWTYDKSTNLYMRQTGGKVHKDLTNDQQMSAKDIVVMFAKETGPVDDHGHLLYNNIGTGTGLLFQNGKSEKITWQKPTLTSRTTFLLSSGKEVQFARGQIWIEMLPIGTQVSY